MNRMLIILVALLIVPSQCGTKPLRVRRREVIEEEIRKHLATSMISLKGEIIDIILEEMMDYYQTQSSKLYRLERELLELKNRSVPISKKRRRSNHLIQTLSQQHQSFTSNLSQIQDQLNNITSVLDKLLYSHSLANSSDDLPIDCDDVLQRHAHLPDRGIFRIQPRLSSQAFNVLCLFENQRAWTVVQQRINGTVNFYRGWNDYKNGFGDLETEFWLGNQRIHELTNQDQYLLRIDLQPWTGSSQFAQYGHFALSNESSHYQLHISDYHVNFSTAGDSLSSVWDSANGVPFSTFDRDHDQLFYDNCAWIYHGAWWFTSCFQSHLNGLYIQAPLATENSARNGLHWNTYALYHSMKQTRMRIRRVSSDPRK